MENKMVNKDGNFSPKGVPIHSQVMKIKQESSDKIIIDLAPGQPEVRPVLREISRQISRSPLGISRRPISVGDTGIRIDYVASKDGAHQKMSCHKSLQPVQKYRVWDSGRSPNELTQWSILVVIKLGVAIVCE
ncbi:hypothetical protein PIB30_002942 [Stylosanthes scabra]|uniref:Uncharacterized protein n=1 Tax=Stylosanthes scabra TaxID=79078 RepID=A0ABU6V1J5_9FABA|nr:hypothetical protein [Stylosanthes scabra]